MVGYFFLPVPCRIGTNGMARDGSPSLEDVSKMENARLRRSSSFILLLTALAIAGCGGSASTDKAKEAPG